MDKTYPMPQHQIDKLYSEFSHYLVTKDVIVLLARWASMGRGKYHYRATRHSIQSYVSARISWALRS